MAGKTDTGMDLRISGIRKESPDIKSIRLDLGENSSFLFRPGQFIIVKVDLWNPRKNRVMPAKRAFSISSSPTEKGFIEIAVKRYPKGRLTPWLHDHLKPGNTLNIKGPEGKFILDTAGYKKIVFIAGGVGIAPLRSMIRYLIEQGNPVGIRLFYSARKPAEFAFKKEFDRQSASHPDMKCIYTLTRPEGAIWTGRTGRFDQAFLKNHMDNTETRYYLCGPLPMVRDIKGNLKDLGVEDSSIVIEMW